MRYLRGLYLDDSLFKEFEVFRSRLAANLPEEIRKTFVEPGVITSCTSLSRFKRSRQYSDSFKAPFLQKFMSTVHGYRHTTACNDGIRES